MELSLLRFLGLFLGATCLFLLLRRLRSHSSMRIDVWGYALVGLVLICVSMFPQILNTPTDILSMSNVPGGRILTLVILIVGLLIYSAISNRSKVQLMRYQLSNYIEHDLASVMKEKHPNAFKPKDILVIIPAWNEAENLTVLLPRFPDKVCNKRLKVLIIDDGSNDNTAKIAEQNHAHVVSHHTNRGGGAALRSGYAVAKTYGSEIIVTMDADGQHDPKQIKELVTPILNDEADFIIGSRLIGSHDQYSQLRIFGVQFFNIIINSLIGTKITDCASGFRAIRFSKLGYLTLIQDQYHTAELIIDAAKKNLRFADRPVHISARVCGQSKKGHSFVYAFGFLNAILQTWWR